MKLEESVHPLEDGDFAIGDSFWVGDIEFEVVDKTGWSA